MTHILQLDFNTQSSSHWDGLRHFPYSETKQFYNGVVQDQISSSHKIGIQSKAFREMITYYTY